MQFKPFWSLISDSAWPYGRRRMCSHLPLSLVIYSPLSSQSAASHSSIRRVENYEKKKGLCYICSRIPPIQTSYISKLPCQALGDNSIGQMLACNHEDPSWVPEIVIKPGMAWTCQLSVGKGEAGGSPGLTGKPNESLRDPGGWILKINPGA